MSFPLISIVTPVYNQAQFIERTMRSVLDQEYPNVEYIVVDGNSSDGTKEIISGYADRLSAFVSEPDQGMYDALSKGFKKATGEIMCYLNADDILYPGTLRTVAEIFAFPGVEWLTGVASSIDESDRIVGVAAVEKWSKYRFYSGDYQWIQQESTFWSKSLWQKSGGFINTSCRLAGDFDLWCRFFQSAELYSVNTILGGFRWRSHNQLSLEGIDDYKKEAAELLRTYKSQLSEEDLRWIERILKYKNSTSKIPVLSRLGFKTDQEWYKYPPLIKFDRLKQKFHLG